MSEQAVALLALSGSGVALWFAGWVTRRVPPNRWAGVRIPATFEDDRVWRETNDRAGRDFQRFGAAFAALALALLPVPQPLGTSLALVVLLGGLTMIVVRAATFASRRLRHYRALDRDEGAREGSDSRA